MSGQWAPGDVAMVTCSDGVERRAFTGRYLQRDTWFFADGSLRDVEVSEARRLAVIDHEDPAAMERLAAIYRDLEGCELGSVAMSLGAYRMQFALREYAAPKPVKPEEPLGLGAVVEDAEGRLWCRLSGRWHCSPSEHSTPYCDIDAVRVLSAGVLNEAAGGTE